jgi:hypothetical protein
VFINAEVIGFEALSRAESYQRIHARLLKSYAMDALLLGVVTNPEPSAVKARAFLREATECKENRFASIGQGFDYRFDGPGVVGSALAHEDDVLHLAFFRLARRGGEEDKDSDILPPSVRRRGMRLENDRLVMASRDEEW